jgi:hypothetical protein
MLYTITMESKGKLTDLEEAILAHFKRTPEASGENSQRISNDPDCIGALMALHLAKAQVIEEHLKTDHPLIVWRDGKVYRQPPEKAKQELEAAIKNDPWSATALHDSHV